MSGKRGVALRVLPASVRLYLVGVILMLGGWVAAFSMVGLVVFLAGVSLLILAALRRPTPLTVVVGAAAFFLGFWSLAVFL